MKRLRARVTYEGHTRWASAYNPADLEKEKVRILAEMMSGIVPVNDKMTFREWTQLWKSNYRANISLNQEKQDDIYLRNVIFPEIGAIKMRYIKPMHIQRIFAEITDKSQSYNHKVYVILNMIFRAAVENDVIRKSPMTMEEPKGKGSNKRRSLTAEERAVLNKVCEHHRGGLFCMLMLNCGLRPQEVAVLTWDDIDLEHKYVYINKALKSDGTVGAPKSTAGNRKVPIPDVLMPRLRAQGVLVCTDTSGNMLTHTSIRGLWKSVKRAMDIEMGCSMKRNHIVQSKIAPDLTLYCLRHTYCTDLEEKGVPINIARQLMGHEDISVTSKIYIHTSDKTLEETRKKINS